MSTQGYIYLGGVCLGGVSHHAVGQTPILLDRKTPVKAFHFRNLLLRTVKNSVILETFT